MRPCWSWPAGALPCWHRYCMMLTWLLAESLPCKQMAIQVCFPIRPHQYSFFRSNLCHWAFCHMSMLMQCEIRSASTFTGSPYGCFEEYDWSCKSKLKGNHHVQVWPLLIAI